MIKFKVTDNESSLQAKISGIEERLDNFPRYFLQELANNLIMNSPVDTGTFITSYGVTAGAGGPASTVSSEGKPRHQAFEPYAQEGLDGLYAGIGSLGMGTSVATIYNVAEHAYKVETEHGYAPVTTTVAAAPQLAAIAADRARVK